MDEQDLKGKTIKYIRVDGFEIYIVFEDGTIFEYSASDDGCSSWKVY